LSKKEWEIAVRTMYKRKDKKAKPVDLPLLGGINPGGGVNHGGENWGGVDPGGGINSGGDGVNSGVGINSGGGSNPGGGVNSGDGVNPRGGINLDRTAEGETAGKFVPKRVPQGGRLTPERLSKMKIGTGFLSDAENSLFIDILFEYEGATAFDESEMGLLNPDIEPPVLIAALFNINITAA
jgi:hypothetical protein